MVDDDDVDTFIIRCNTPGELLIVLFSNSEIYFMEDLDMYLTVAGETTPAAVTGYYVTDEGNHMLALSYTVTTPGVYALYIMSDYLYKYYDINTDYTFYYMFTPA